MSGIELKPELREALAEKLKNYLDEELGVELGGFDAQFLLDYFASQLGCYYYNQGLADALTAFEGKLGEVGELIYELEQLPAGDD